MNQEAQSSYVYTIITDQDTVFPDVANVMGPRDYMDSPDQLGPTLRFMANPTAKFYLNLTCQIGAR
jgi:hypothetical protein